MSEETKTVESVKLSEEAIKKLKEYMQRQAVLEAEISTYILGIMAALSLDPKEWLLDVRKGAFVQKEQAKKEGKE